MNIPDVCTGRATHGHHRIPKSQGGADTLENCIPSCVECHDYAHNHPSAAAELGLIVRGPTPGDRS